MDTSALAVDQWGASSEQLEGEGSEGEEDGKETLTSSSLTSSISSIIHPHHSVITTPCHLTTNNPSAVPECSEFWVSGTCSLLNTVPLANLFMFRFVIVLLHSTIILFYLLSILLKFFAAGFFF